MLLLIVMRAVEVGLQGDSGAVEAAGLNEAWLAAQRGPPQPPPG